MPPHAGSGEEHRLDQSKIILRPHPIHEYRTYHPAPTYQTYSHHCLIASSYFVGMGAVASLFELWKRSTIHPSE
ncbi:hypothetical protein BN874_340069 [Candidatus Contendobacter odensis Run_B_J11]|uniref:Uncharacterized protein n=1 Tax=Candidatus Contendobacter odensis Run_B_J11 TaxID=1400861 RepID=A0A7U7GE18_9GAMM|nr:hypothetical protein BN874_340069 [Candidatus Contendobacter odensis Run_B_J11]